VVSSGVTQTTLSSVGKKLYPLVKGRLFVLVGDSVAALGAEADSLLALGAARVLLIGDGLGISGPPDDPRVEWRLLDVGEREVSDGRRRAAASLSALPSELVSWLDAFDPARSAEVFNFNGRYTASTIAGRRISGTTRPDWVALDDKTVCDRLWDAAHVRRAASSVSEVRRDKLRHLSDEHDRGQGTVWAGDAREGPNSGADLTRWIRDVEDFEEAIAFFGARCDRIRIMPFIEGVPCCVHVIITNDGIGVLRPCETIILRTSGFGRFRLAGVASSFDPSDEDREDMRGAARRVGEVLSARLGYRGTFSLDGVLGKDGFIPTELNPRVGRALRMMVHAVPDAGLVAHANFLASGRDTGLNVADVEGAVLETVDHVRALWAALPLPTAPPPASVDLVFTGSRLTRALHSETRDAIIRCGSASSYTPGLISLAGEPGRVPSGPSSSTIVADALNHAEEWLGVDVGPYEAPERVR
jgi:hypothetical protein